jgi:hypothetical protein
MPGRDFDTVRQLGLGEGNRDGGEHTGKAQQLFGVHEHLSINE